MASDDDEWDPDTGITDPPQRLRAATPRGGTNSDKGSSARAAFREIRELGKKLDEHSRADQESLSQIHVTLTGLQVTSANMQGSVSAMVDELRHRREIQKIEIAGEVTGRVEKQITVREQLSNRTKIWLALIAVLATAVGAVGTWLVG